MAEAFELSVAVNLEARVDGAVNIQRVFRGIEGCGASVEESLGLLPPCGDPMRP